MESLEIDIALANFFLRFRQAIACDRQKCVLGFSSPDPTRSLKGARGNPCKGIFWTKKAPTRKRRNETALNPIENKQNGEMNDSAYIMISMAYAHRCETFGFASRNRSLAFSGFALRLAGKRNGFGLASRPRNKALCATQGPRKRS
jgi:hypothetical protein